MPEGLEMSAAPNGAACQPAFATGAEELPAGELPAVELFAGVVGQRDAVARLRRAAVGPVHAYLLVGPPGSGKRALARGFGAALLCPTGGCGACEVCRRALAGLHPDLLEVERAGAALGVDQVREVVRLAGRRPVEGHRQVMVIGDVHLGRLAMPALLKTLEEPPGDTVFVLLADAVASHMATIASRCVRVEIGPVPPGEIAAWLESEGMERSHAVEIAGAAGGSIERARLMSEDPGFLQRRELWASVPARIDGTGASVVVLAAELLASAESATEVLRRRHAEEMNELVSRAKEAGERALAGRKEIEERHHREERRFRVDELRAGMGVLAGVLRDRLVAAAGAPDPEQALDPEQASGLPDSSGLRSMPDAVAPSSGVRRWLEAVGYVEQSMVDLGRNPNEPLLLQVLLVRLSMALGA